VCMNYVCIYAWMFVCMYVLGILDVRMYGCVYECMDGCFMYVNDTGELKQSRNSHLPNGLSILNHVIHQFCV
jgi:hypothetical protein